MKEPIRLWPDPNSMGLVTDLYQLTMMAGYRSRSMDQLPATFELFVRKLPKNRGYLVFAGLEQAINDLLELRFSDDQIQYLKDHPAFQAVDAGWFQELESFRFTGNVFAMPEGTVAFANEPIVRVEAPLAQAQWVETYLLASLAYPTMAATKAARVVEAGQGRGMIDFGARRGHGPHSGFLCARSAYISGFLGTSHVEAARILGIPAIGTMAHAWVQSFEDEREAFAAFAKQFPNAATLLVDTYDVLRGVERASQIEPPAQGVRIDSGNFAELAPKAREILDRNHRQQTKIVVSGDMDEYKIADLAAIQSPIDAFGVGTELITSGDAPALSMVYKLVELNHRGTIKLAPGKKSYPYSKQVFRQSDDNGQFSKDLVAQRDERTHGEPLLRCVVKDGKPVEAWPELNQVRDYAKSQRERLPDRLRSLHAVADYPVEYSELLETHAREIAKIGAGSPSSS